MNQAFKESLFEHLSFITVLNCVVSFASKLKDIRMSSLWPYKYQQLHHIAYFCTA